MLEKLQAKWDLLPKTAKVLVYVMVSTVLSETAIELAGMQQAFFVRVLAQIVNVLIVFLQESAPTVKAMFKK